MKIKLPPKLKEIFEQQHRSEFMSEAEITELAGIIRELDFRIWWTYIEDSASYLEFYISSDAVDRRFYDLGFWEIYGKKEHRVLFILFSRYGKYVTSYWNTFTNPRIEKKGVILSKNPPTKKGKELQDVIIEVLRSHGHEYVTPHDWDEESGGKTLYTLLFGYY